MKTIHYGRYTFIKITIGRVNGTCVGSCALPGGEGLERLHGGGGCPGGIGK